MLLNYRSSGPAAQWWYELGLQDVVGLRVPGGDFDVLFVPPGLPAAGSSPVFVPRTFPRVAVSGDDEDDEVLYQFFLESPPFKLPTLRYSPSPAPQDADCKRNCQL